MTPSHVRRIPSFVVEQMEARRLMSATPIVNGVAVDFGYDAVKAAAAATELGATTVRIFNTTGTKSNNAVSNVFGNPDDDFTADHLQKIKAYYDAGLEVTLLVTPPQTSAVNGKYPVNASYSAQTVSKYFQKIMTDPKYTTSAAGGKLKEWVTNWEIVNEPNSPKYYNSTSSGDVTQNLQHYVSTTLAPAYGVLHGAGETVIGGGITTAFNGAVNTLKAANYNQFVDIGNMHPYYNNAKGLNDRIHEFEVAFPGLPLTSTEWNTTRDPDDASWAADNNAAYNGGTYNGVHFDGIKDRLTSQYYFRLAYEVRPGSDRITEAGLVFKPYEGEQSVPNYTPHEPFYQMYKGWTTATTPPTPPTPPPTTALHIEAEGGILFNCAYSSSPPPHVGNVGAGDYMRFNGIDFGASPRSTVSLNVASPYSAGLFEVRLDSSTGTLIGTVDPDATGGWTTYQAFTAPVSNVTGTHDLFVVAKAESSGAYPNVDWIEFGGATAPAPGPQPLTASDDGFVRDGSYSGTALNTESSTALEVKTVPTSAASGYNRQAFLKFNTAGVGTNFSAATVRLWGQLNPAADPVLTRLYTAGDNWTESTLTWNNRPNVSSTQVSSNTLTTTTPQWFTFDVTSALRGERTAGDSTFSVALIADASDPSKAVFDSSESTGGHAPELVIT